RAVLAAWMLLQAVPCAASDLQPTIVIDLEECGSVPNHQFVAFDTLLVIDDPSAQNALVVLNGQRMEYPFTLTVGWKDEEQRRGEFHINGVLARTLPKPKPMPDYPVGDLAKRRRLFDHARELEARLYDQGLSRTERVRALAEMFRSVPWIEYIEVFPTSVMIHPRPEEDISATAFNVYPRGAERSPNEVPPGPPDVRGVFLSNAKSYGRLIGSGGYLIMGDDHFPVVGGCNLRRRIEEKTSEMLNSGESDPNALLADIPELAFAEAAAEVILSAEQAK
ncbi:MAG: hypothetical protein KAW17_02155, partial [Candidatus Eisenbacteria sp.]|nr:hypothetical protein [Candidatus Eisenbacteria bacterium]